MKVMIVDDNAADRRLLRVNLEHHTCEVVEAADGRQALILAQWYQPDLIISDALMPDMDGFQFLRAVKRNATLMHIPFIFYSAVYTGHKEEALAKSLGAEAFIVKPKDPVAFWEEVVGIVDACRAREGRTVVQGLVQEEEDFLRMYSHVVARKLEEKVAELSTACAELQKREADATMLSLQWQSTFDAVKEAVWICDEGATILQCNRATSDLLGMPKDDIIGKTCFTLLHGAPISINECPMERVKASGKRESAHFVLNGKHIDVTVDPITSLNGGTRRFVHTASDISERVRAGEERKKLEAQLAQSQKMEAVGQLAGGIAHDFNNILSVIVGYAELAKLKLGEDSPAGKFIDNLMDGADRATGLIRSLLTFSKTQMMDMAPVDINQIVGRVRMFLERIIGEDIRLVTEIAGQELLVMADGGQIQQVLINLAINARDAMPDGGTLVIRTEQVMLDTETVTQYGGCDAGAYAFISVTDTGVGMDEAVKGKIFEPFFTTKESGKGSGLGLPMVYGIIKQHNGFINVYSEPDEGTEFRIYLPLVNETVACSSPSSLPYPPNGTETILIAEDNDALRDVADELFTSFGYKVISARDGEDALKKFIAHADAVDLCFLDMIMPGKGGKETFEEISRLQPDMKFLFASGYTADTIFRKGIADIHSNFIVKPFAPKLLLRKVREILDGTDKMHSDIRPHHGE